MSGSFSIAQNVAMQQADQIIEDDRCKQAEEEDMRNRRPSQMRIQETFGETLDVMSLSVITYLSSHEGVQDVTLGERPARLGAITQWESKNEPLKLPVDYKAFMQSSDGLLLQWNVAFRGRILPFGCMHLNKLEDVVPVENNSFVSKKSTLFASPEKCEPKNIV